MQIDRNKLTGLMHLGAIDEGRDMMGVDEYDKLIADLQRRQEDEDDAEQMEIETE